MTDNVENIILEHLRAIRSEIANARADLGDMKLRMGSIEEHVAGMRRDMSILLGDIAITHKGGWFHDSKPPINAQYPIQSGIKNPRLEKSGRGSSSRLRSWRIASANPPYSV